MQQETYDLLERVVKNHLEELDSMNLEDENREEYYKETAGLVERLITADKDSNEAWDKQERRRIEEKRNNEANALEQDKQKLGWKKIGFEMAKNFIAHGCKVIIAGTNETKLDSCLHELNEIEQKSAEKIIINVLDTKSLKGKVLEAVELFEERKIDILVNSAGVNDNRSFFEVTEDSYQSIMDVNVKGTFFMCQAISEYMINNSIKGHILNVSSSSALRPAMTPYIMSKWSIRGLTLGMADILLPHGIIVNAIAPGAVATPMLGMKDGNNINNQNAVVGRYALPSEIANLATFMVSDLGNLIVGDTFYISGGSGVISLHK